LEQEGLSEREEGLRLIKETADCLEKGFQAGLYSFKAKQKIILEIAQNTSLSKMRDLNHRTKNLAKKEGEQYANIESSVFTREKITVHGKSIRAMSDKSIQAFVAGYKEYSLKEREETKDWREIARNEGKLIEQLGTIYQDDPQAFKIALEGFETLGYQEKVKALKTHERTVEENTRETTKQSLSILRNSLREIDQARQNKTISLKTAKRYQETLQDKSKYTDPDTGKIDLKKQQAILDHLTAKTPVEKQEERNLAAYEVARTQFKKELQEFATANPTISGEKIRDMQAEYDESTFSEREKLQEELEAKMAKIKKRKESNQGEAKKLGVTQTKEAPKRENVISIAEQCIKEKTPESLTRGLKTIYAYLGHPDTPEEALSDEKIKNSNSIIGRIQNIHRNRRKRSRRTKRRNEANSKRSN
jgi:hypothetical protein